MMKSKAHARHRAGYLVQREPMDFSGIAMWLSSQFIISSSHIIRNSKDKKESLSSKAKAGER